LRPPFCDRTGAVVELHEPAVDIDDFDLANRPAKLEDAVEPGR